MLGLIETEAPFCCDKKVGNAHSKLLAYRSYSCIQTTQNGEVDFAQFPMV